MRNKSPSSKSTKGGPDTEHKNDAYEHDVNLPNNPLYHTKQGEDEEVGYSTVEDQHHTSIPPSQIETDHSDNATSLQKNKQNQNHPPEIPVYAVPNKPKNPQTEKEGGAVTTGGAVYAQINKPKKATPQTPVRTQNQDGLVYMEVDHGDTPITQNAPHNMITAESVTYAEIEK
jgi:hypothetical protein